MHPRPIIITPKEIKGARQLSAPELNRIHFSLNHTILTPKRLAATDGNKPGIGPGNKTAAVNVSVNVKN